MSFYAYVVRVVVISLVAESSNLVFLELVC